MRDETKEHIALIVAVILIAGLSVLAGAGFAFQSWRKEAVEKGHAEWYVKDHIQEWRWLPENKAL